MVEFIFGNLLNLGQFGVLCGIFLRLGRVVSDVSDLKTRVFNLEKAEA